MHLLTVSNCEGFSLLGFWERQSLRGGSWKPCAVICSPKLHHVLGLVLVGNGKCAQQCQPVKGRLAAFVTDL